MLPFKESGSGDIYYPFTFRARHHARRTVLRNFEFEGRRPRHVLFRDSFMKGTQDSEYENLTNVYFLTYIKKIIGEYEFM